MILDEPFCIGGMLGLHHSIYVTEHFLCTLPGAGVVHSGLAGGSIGVRHNFTDTLDVPVLVH